jgi:hypothetical protein
MYKVENSYLKIFMFLILAINIVVLAYMIMILNTINGIPRQTPAYQVAKQNIKEPNISFITNNSSDIRPVILLSGARDKKVEESISNPSDKNLPQDDLIEISAKSKKQTIKEVTNEKTNLIKQVKNTSQLKYNNSDDQVEIINSYVKNVCAKYNEGKNQSEIIEPELVQSMIYHESRYNPKSKNGTCTGLMQVSTRWHGERAERLGVTDFYDSYSNVLLGVDYISELFYETKDIRLALMYYSMNHEDALAMYNRGEISTYAKTVLATAETYKKRE